MPHAFLVMTVNWSYCGTKIGASGLDDLHVADVQNVLIAAHVGYLFIVVQQCMLQCVTLYLLCGRIIEVSICFHVLY